MSDNGLGPVDLILTALAPYTAEETQGLRVGRDVMRASLNGRGIEITHEDAARIAAAVVGMFSGSKHTAPIRPVSNVLEVASVEVLENVMAQLARYLGIHATPGLVVTTKVFADAKPPRIEWTASGFIPKIASFAAVMLRVENKIRTEGDLPDRFIVESHVR